MDVEGLLALGCRSRSRIGIGLPDDLLAATVSSLRERGCEVALVRSDDPRELVDALERGEVDAAVRGTLGSAKVIDALVATFALKRIMRTAVLATSEGTPFMLTPVGIDEGRTLGDRFGLVRATLDYFEPAGWRPTIGVLSKGRPDDAHRGDDIRMSLEEGEEMAEVLRAEGVDARHYSILVEQAVLERDLVVAPDGVSGNLMFRSMHFVGGGRAYGAPIVNIPKVFVDTSRAKRDFVEPVLLAAGLSAARDGAGPERRNHL
jgi:putative methanogen marker protein 4